MKYKWLHWKDGFLRHRRSIKSTSSLRCEVKGEIALNPALAHRLDESRLVIPWQVAPQQSLPPLHQLSKFCNIQAVGSNDLTKMKNSSFRFLYEATNHRSFRFLREAMGQHQLSSAWSTPRLFKHPSSSHSKTKQNKSVSAGITLTSFPLSPYF